MKLLRLLHKKLHKIKIKMKKRQSSIRNMYQVVINILDLFSATWAGFAAFVLAVANFKAKVDDIDETAGQQQASLDGYTTNKRHKKRDMANKSLLTRGKVSAFAFVTGDTILQGKMKISLWKLYYKKDTTAIANAELIYSSASAMTQAQRTEYDISDQEMLGLRAAIDAFINLPSPQQMKAIRKQLTAELKAQFKEASAQLTESLDGLMHEYQGSDFFEQYQNARRIVDSVRHTTIEGEVLDFTTGADLKNVKVILTSTDGTESFEEMTDVQGKFKRGELNPELDWTAKFEIPGYETVETPAIDLKRGEHERLNIKMKKL